MNRKIKLNVVVLFLSTLPQGERPGYAFPCLIQENDFYPRSRKGSDIIRYRIRNISIYFYPRSRKGSDWGLLQYYDQVDEFLSTLPQGERLISSFLTLDILHFYPRSRKGSDMSYLGHLRLI